MQVTSSRLTKLTRFSHFGVFTFDSLLSVLRYSRWRDAYRN